MTDEKASAKTADEIALFASLFRHPLRVRLVRALGATGPSSATVLSDQLGDASVSDCHYHLKTLREGGVIKLVDSRSVRGATERIYRLAPRTRATRGAMHLRQFIDVVMPTSPAKRAPMVGALINERHEA